MADSKVVTVHIAGAWEMEYLPEGSAGIQRHVQRCLYCDALLRSAPARSDPPAGYAAGERVGLNAAGDPTALRHDPTVEKECHPR